MNELAYTLLTDGASDEILLPILTWLLEQAGVDCPIRPVWADLRRLPRPPHGLEERIWWAIELFPCEILFVHRDAEREPRERRVTEIMNAIRDSKGHEIPTVICVIPVRMQEAWLLTNERAIRRAAGNPNGAVPLALPPIKDIESLPDPKRVLHTMLSQASGLYGRQLRQFSEHTAARRVVEYSDDFAPLRHLSAFATLELDVREIARSFGFESH